MTTIQYLEARMARFEDMEAVRELMARYQNACDGDKATGTHRDPEAIAMLFIPDGIYEIPGGPYAGRAAIAAVAKSLQSIAWIIHTAVNPVVSICGDDARGDFKGLVRWCATPDAEPQCSVGRYDVEAVRTAEGWRFRRLSWSYSDSSGTQTDQLKTIIAEA